MCMGNSFSEPEKISVIVAVYNIEKYVGRCIESILNQSYSELQIILVDDGSTDESGKICDDYAIKDLRIQVIHQENQGLSMARNTGIQYAEGAWLSFIDGDDIIHPQFIEILHRAIYSSSSQIAICDYLKGDDQTVFSKDELLYTDKYIELTSNHMLEEWHGKNLDIETVAWNKLYDRELFRDGIRYPKGKIHEDVLITHRIVANANKVVIVPYKLYIYIQRNDSIIGSKLTERRIKQSLEAQEGRLVFFDKDLYPKANRRLKIGMMKHLIFFYFRVTFRLGVCVKNYRSTKVFLGKKIWKMCKDWKNV